MERQIEESCVDMDTEVIEPDNEHNNIREEINNIINGDSKQKQPTPPDPGKLTQPELQTENYCSPCNKSFKTLQAYRLHQTYHQRKARNTCSYCMVNFSGPKVLDRHLKFVHNIVSINTPEINHEPIPESRKISRKVRRPLNLSRKRPGRPKGSGKSMLKVDKSHLKLNRQHQHLKHKTISGIINLGNTGSVPSSNRAVCYKTQECQTIHQDKLDYEKRCPVCDEFTFNSPGVMVCHFIKSHTKRMFCNACNLGFESRVLFRKHVVYHVNTVFNSCNLCGLAYDCPLRLADHLDIMHGGNYRSDSSKQMISSAFSSFTVKSEPTASIKGTPFNFDSSISIEHSSSPSSESKNILQPVLQPVTEDINHIMSNTLSELIDDGSMSKSNISRKSRQHNIVSDRPSSVGVEDDKEGSGSEVIIDGMIINEIEMPIKLQQKSLVSPLFRNMNTPTTPKRSSSTGARRGRSTSRCSSGSSKSQDNVRCKTSPRVSSSSPDKESPSKESMRLAFQCNICKLSFKNFIHMMEHKLIAHESGKRKTKPPTRLIEEGDNEQPTEEIEISKSRFVSVYDNITCTGSTECNEKFTSFIPYRAHFVATHTKDLDCLVCKASYASKEVFNCHVRYHLQKSKYTCPDCGSIFDRTRLAVSHFVNTHGHQVEVEDTTVLRSITILPRDDLSTKQSAIESSGIENNSIIHNDVSISELLQESGNVLNDAVSEKIPPQERDGIISGRKRKISKEYLEPDKSIDKYESSSLPEPTKRVIFRNKGKGKGCGIRRNSWYDRGKTGSYVPKTDFSSEETCSDEAGNTSNPAESGNISKVYDASKFPLENLYTCGLCKKQFQVKYNMSCHMREMHQDDAPNLFYRYEKKCPICNVFHGATNVYKHMKAVHGYTIEHKRTGRPPNTVSNLTVGDKSESLPSNHQWMLSKTGPPYDISSWKCYQCGLLGTNKQMFYKHVSKCTKKFVDVGVSPSVSSSTTSVIVYDNPSDSSTKSQQELSTPDVVVSSPEAPGKLFTCPSCGIICSTSSNLKRHSLLSCTNQSNTNKSPPVVSEAPKDRAKKYLCSDCGKSFGFPHSLMRHKADNCGKVSSSVDEDQVVNEVDLGNLSEKEFDEEKNKDVEDTECVGDDKAVDTSAGESVAEIFGGFELSDMVGGDRESRDDSRDDSSAMVPPKSDTNGNVVTDSGKEGGVNERTTDETNGSPVTVKVKEQGLPDVPPDTEVVFMKPVVTGVSFEFKPKEHISSRGRVIKTKSPHNWDP